MTRAALLSWCIPLLLAAGPAFGTADSIQEKTCSLAVTEHWPQSVKPQGSEMQAARHKVFNELGTVMASAFANGGYKQNPKSFPLHYMDFRGNKIVFEFGVYCPRARLYLGELLQTYRQHLPAAHQDLPELSIDN